MSEMGRGALQVTVRANNRDVHIVVAHMKSKLLTFPGGSFTPDDEDQRARFAAFALYRRASEATTLRSHVDAVLAGGGRDVPEPLEGRVLDLGVAPDHEPGRPRPRLKAQGSNALGVPRLEPWQGLPWDQVVEGLAVVEVVRDVLADDGEHDEDLGHLASVSRQLGHARPSVTLDIYAGEFDKTRSANSIRDRLVEAFGG